jgi:hypothetical protein
MTRGQFAAVVHSKSLRPATLGDNRIQHTRHTRTGEAGVHFQRQAFARKCVHHSEHPHGSAIRQAVVHEVQRPLFVGRCGPRPRLTGAHQALAPLALDAQPRRTINAEQPFVIHYRSLPTHQHAQAAIAIARLLLRQLGQPSPQHLVALLVRLEAIRRSWNLGQLASPAHASVEGCP